VGDHPNTPVDGLVSGRQSTTWNGAQMTHNKRRPGTPDQLCVGTLGLTAVDVAATAPAVRLRPELPLKLHQAPDPGAVGADVRLELGGQLADGGQVDAEQLCAPLQRRRDRPAQVRVLPSPHRDRLANTCSRSNRECYLARLDGSVAAPPAHAVRMTRSGVQTVVPRGRVPPGSKRAATAVRNDQGGRPKTVEDHDIRSCHRQPLIWRFSRIFPGPQHHAVPWQRPSADLARKQSGFDQLAGERVPAGEHASCQGSAGDRTNQRGFRAP
jgi:hypothetical protein